MSKWYEMNCVNHRDWMIENYENLELDPKEMILCLAIDYYNSLKEVITYDMLAKKLSTSIAEIDIILSRLTARGVMIITLGNGKMTFDLNPLFEMKYLNDNDYETVFKYFEDSFNRPLNSTELTKISDLMAVYSKEDIINAIRIADANQKVSVSYIEGILRNNDYDKKD